MCIGTALHSSVSPFRYHGNKSNYLHIIPFNAKSKRCHDRRDWLQRRLQMLSRTNQSSFFFTCLIEIRRNDKRIWKKKHLTFIFSYFFLFPSLRISYFDYVSFAFLLFLSFCFLPFLFFFTKSYRSI